jgi:hypothetical protein
MITPLAQEVHGSMGHAIAGGIWKWYPAAPRQLLRVSTDLSIGLV